jgi:formylglycine-generating enzyme required for sulfatase activity
LGGETADALTHLLRGAGPYFAIKRPDNNLGDIVLEGKLENTQILVRCIDNPRDSGLPNPMLDLAAIKDHIVAAAQLLGASKTNQIETRGMKAGASSEEGREPGMEPKSTARQLTGVHVLTWNDAAARILANDASQRGIKLESVSEFLTTVLNFRKALDTVDNLLRQKLGPAAPKNLDDMDWLAQQWQLNGLSGRELDDDDLIDIMCGNEQNPSGRRIFLSFAKTGGGKSSLLLRTARRLLKDEPNNAEDKQGMLRKIPVVIRGKDLAADSSYDGLANAISKSLDLMYDLSLPVASAKELLKAGYLYVMIDSLEEITEFHSFRALEAFIRRLPAFDSDLLLTSRLEIFSLNEQAVIARKTADGRLNWVHPPRYRNDPDSVPKVPSVKLQPIRNIDSSILRPALHCLVNRPLFYQVLSEETAQSYLADLSVNETERSGALEQNVKLHRLFERITRRWARQVIDGYPSAIEVTVDHFLNLCTSLVGVFFELAVERQSVLKNQMVFPLEDILERLNELEWRPPATKGISKDDFAKLMRYSTVMCHETRDQLEIGELCLPSTSILTFFLARYLVECFWGTVDKAYANTRLLIERLGLTSLQRLTIPYEEDDLRNVSSDCDTDAKCCLLMFVSGWLSAEGLPVRLEVLLSDISGQNPRRATAQREDVQSLSLIDLRAPLWLSENLLYLTSNDTPQLEAASLSLSSGRQPSELSGLSCPVSDLTWVLPTLKGPDAKMSANLEFSKLPKPLTPQAQLSAFTRSPLEGPQAIVKDKRAQHFLLSLFTQWSTQHLGKLRIVLGGTRDLGRYSHDEMAEVSGLANPEKARFVKVQHPSFLIQDNPVTNEQFLRFLKKSKDGKRWDPLIVRDETRNDYYLRHWDAPIPGVGLKHLLDYSLEELVVDDRLKDWLAAPVIYVNWLAAKAFATWVHCRLPTETEYEMAARAFQPRDLAAHQTTEIEPGSAPRFGPELPWFDLESEFINGINFEKEGSLEHFAVRLESLIHEESEKQTASDSPQKRPDQLSKVFPYIRRELEPESQFREWAKSKAEALRATGMDERLVDALQPVKHLVGGLRYWMEDFWNPCWPPFNTRVNNGDSMYIESPFQDGWCGVDDDGALRYSEQQAQWREDHQRVLRGSSLQMADSQMRISFRESQRETNVNPDVGFRCVRPIWPNRSIEYAESSDRS